MLIAVPAAGLVPAEPRIGHTRPRHPTPVDTHEHHFCGLVAAAAGALARVARGSCGLDGRLGRALAGILQV